MLLFLAPLSVSPLFPLFILAQTALAGDPVLTNLFHSLFTNYNKEIRPVIQSNSPVDTSISFTLKQVVDVDERNQLLTCLAWIHFHWNDWRLAWDPRLNGRITKLNVPVEFIWTPDIILYNNAASEYLREMTTASVTYDGNISLSMAGIFKSSCELDVRFYPFDFQNCLMRLASWAYDGTKIDIHADSRSDQTNYMVVSTEWTLREIWSVRESVIYSCCAEPYPFIDVHLLLERKPLFFVIFSCLPCVLISVLVLLGFYMPTDSGEKVTLGITSLLSTTVFLMLVSEHLPPTADALPLIGIYYGVTIFIVSLQTAFTVFTLNIHHIGSHGPPVPRLLQSLLFGRFSRLLLLELEPNYHSINEHVNYFIGKQAAEEEERRRRSRDDGQGRLAPAAEVEHNGEEDTAEQPAVWQRNSIAGRGGNNNKELAANSAPSSVPPAPIPSAAAEQAILNKKRVSFPDSCQQPQQNGAPASFRQASGGGFNRYRRVLSLVNASRAPTAGQEQPSRRSRDSTNPPSSRTSRTSSASSEITGDGIGFGRGGLCFEGEFIRVLGRLQEVIQRNELRLLEKDRRNAEKLEWQQVALVLDRFFLVVFALITLLVLYGTLLGDRSIQQQPSAS